VGCLLLSKIRLGLPGLSGHGDAIRLTVARRTSPGGFPPAPSVHAEGGGRRSLLVHSPSTTPMLLGSSS
jgi:hypothetical protein